MILIFIYIEAFSFKLSFCFEFSLFVLKAVTGPISNVKILKMCESTET